MFLQSVDLILHMQYHTSVDLQIDLQKLIELWKAAKRILRYLKAAINTYLIYRKSKKQIKITAYSDANGAADKVDRKSTIFLQLYIQNIFSSDSPTAWFSKNQATVALSTAEAEYVASAQAVSELIYIKGIVSGLCNTDQTFITNLFKDNQSTRKLIENDENSKRTKYIVIKAHFVRYFINKKIINLYHINTNEDIADILTKALSCKIHKFFTYKLVLVLFIFLFVVLLIST